MKKALAAFILLSFTCLPLMAQKLKYGIKLSGGFGFQQIINSNILYYSSVKTLNIRGVIQKELGKNYWLEGALGYMGKGSEVSIDALTTITHINYAEFSVSAMRKWRFTDLGVFYLGVGPYLATGVNGKLKYKTPGSDTEDDVKFGIDSDIKRFDSGANFTTGLEFRNHVTFNLGFSVGLTNIASEPQQDSGTPIVRNRQFLIGLGYMFK